AHLSGQGPAFRRFAGIDPVHTRTPTALPGRPRMSTDFSSIHNHYEQPVFEAVLRTHAHYPQIAAPLLPDVACVALNRLPVRYIRHDVDLAFYLSERERAQQAQAIDEAVRFAFEFVQARTVLGART